VAKELETFQDLIDDINESNLTDEMFDETNTREAPEGTAPTDTGESTAPEGQVEPDSDETDADQSDAEEATGQTGSKDEEDVETEPQPSDEDSDKPDEEEGEPSSPTSEEGEEESKEEVEEDLYELPTGEKVPVEELVRGYLRQNDYTRKAQTLAQQRQATEERVSGLTSLVQETVKDPTMKEFLASHPEAMGYLIENPDATRALLGRETEIKKFWREFEIISEDPEIAERFLKRPEQTVKQVDHRVQFNQAVQFAKTFDDTVAEVVKEFEGVEADEVSAHFGQLIGAEPNAGLGAREFIGAMERLWNVSVAAGKDGRPAFRRDIIKREAQRLADLAAARKNDTLSKTQKHNEAVDAALRKESAPPATPGGGTSPAPAEEKQPQYESLSEILADLSPLD
jgi:hypothetical protein